VPAVFELEIIGITCRREPSKPGVLRPIWHAGLLLVFPAKLPEELIEDGVNAIIGGPGRGRETGCLQTQLSALVDQPS